MALRRATEQARVAQLCLCVGVTTFVLALTIRRLREDHLVRHKPSKRSEDLTAGCTPAHILEHIARQADAEYVCLSIAENKLTTVAAAILRGVDG